MISRAFFSRRAAAALIASTAAFVGLAHPSGASAGIILCRDDPVVLFSNGGSVHLDAVIGDTASDVQSLTYVVHVPQGTSVRGTVTTGGPLSGRTSISTRADANPGTYSVDATVTTGQSSSVQLTVRVPGMGSAQTSGTSGSLISAQVG